MQFARVTVKFWCEFYWISSKISTHLEWLEAAGAVCWLGPGEGWCGDDAAPLQPRPRGHPRRGQQQGLQQQVQGGQGQHHVSREGRGEQLHCIYPLALCLVVGYHLGFLWISLRWDKWSLFPLVHLDIDWHFLAHFILFACFGYHIQISTRTQVMSPQFSIYLHKSAHVSTCWSDWTVWRLLAKCLECFLCQSRNVTGIMNSRLFKSCECTAHEAASAQLIYYLLPP